MRHTQRNLQGLESNKITSYGVRLGDKMIFMPFQGKKKILKLQRTLIEFKSDFIHCNHENDLDPHGLQAQQEPSLGGLFLPGLSHQNLHFQLQLCAAGASQESQESGRYLLKSHNGTPFCINGTLSYESFLERGDKVGLGHNTLLFEEALTEKIITGDLQEEVFLNNHQLMQSHLNILLEGETGTGKSRLAKLIHEKSGRMGRFVHINLSSFSHSLLESELFGHVKGAFTGALYDKKGAFLEAHRGTLFLDEIDSLPKEIQTKLLLFLETHEVRPVGGDKNILCDVRLIFASGKRPLIQVEKGEMRLDFYYRISSGVNLYLESLRDRPEKIQKICQELSFLEDIVISQKLMDFYLSLPWPGNIRQLISHVKKKKVMSKGRKLEFDQFDEDLLTQSSNLFDLHEECSFLQLEEIKFNYVLKVYQHFEGDLKTSSKILNITSNTIKSILKKNKVPL